MQNMFLALLIGSILRWKNFTRAGVLVHFSRNKLNELTEQLDMFYYILINHGIFMLAL